MSDSKDNFLENFTDEYLKNMLDSANDAKETAKLFQEINTEDAKQFAGDYYELSHYYNELAYQYEVALKRRKANSDKPFSFPDHYVKLMAKHASLLTQHIDTMLKGNTDKLHQTCKTYNMLRAEAMRKRLSIMKH